MEPNKCARELMLYGYVTTREVADAAFALGYDSVKIRDIRDSGGETDRNPVGTVYIFKNADAVKSADPVTYDDSGEIIPLSERFKTDREGEEAWKNEDVRYRLKGYRADGIEVYETSQKVLNMSEQDRKNIYLDMMKNQYKGRTARLVRNGHTYYAAFDPDNIRKPIFGEKRSSESGKKAFLSAAADGDVFDLVQNSDYEYSKVNEKNHTKADYFD